MIPIHPESFYESTVVVVRGMVITHHDIEAAMKRTTHHVLDAQGTIKARLVLPEGEPPVLPPWVQHQIMFSGWRVYSEPSPGPGVAIHGYADWKGVADNLANIMRTLLSNDAPITTTDEEAWFARAQDALNDYDMAVMEVGLAEPSTEPGTRGTDGDQA